MVSPDSRLPRFAHRVFRIRNGRAIIFTNIIGSKKSQEWT